MTTHSYHPDTHTHGLCDDCPRCAEHAAHPLFGLDQQNFARIYGGGVYSRFDEIAREHIFDEVRRARELLARVEETTGEATGEVSQGASSPSEEILS